MRGNAPPAEAGAVVRPERRVVGRNGVGLGGGGEGTQNFPLRDGAGKVRGFFSITLPLLTPTIFFNLVMQTINGFMVFNSGYIITQGKPLNSTLFYALYLYQKAFTDYDMGYACAMAWVLLVIIGLMTALLFSSSRRWVFYQGAR